MVEPDLRDRSAAELSQQLGEQRGGAPGAVGLDRAVVDRAGELGDESVLGADGGGAYSYSGESTSCATRKDAPEIAVPRAQVAVNRISIPWRAERRDESGDLIFDFDYPACGTYSGQGHDDGWIVVAEVPVGPSCGQTKAGTQRYGPVEPEHGPLGPFRDVNGTRQPLLTN